MKKYGFAYVFLFLLLIAIQVTKGIRITVSKYQYCVDDYILTYDGRIVTFSLLVYNIAIIAICLIGAIVLTFRKENKMKLKWLILGIMLLYSTFLPIEMVERTSRFDPQDVKIYYESFMTPFLELGRKPIAL